MFLTWCAYGSDSVYTNTRKTEKDSNSITISSGKNMVASCQICFRNLWEEFEVKEVVAKKLPKGVTMEVFRQDYITYNDGVPYPDKLSTDVTLKGGLTQRTYSYVLLFNVSEDAIARTHKIKVIVKTDRKEDPVYNIALNIYKVNLKAPKDSTFYHELWFNPVRHFKSDAKDYVVAMADTEYGYDRYSDKWWDLQVEIAKSLQKLRVNSIWTLPLELLRDSGSKRISKTEWDLNFDLFDKWVQLYLDNGSFKYICLSTLIASVHGKTMKGLDYDGNPTVFNIYTDECEAWADAYLSGFYNHFKEKGWLDKLIIHLQDEPHSSEYWIWAKKKADKLMPGILCSDAIDVHISHEIADHCNCYVPRIDIFEEAQGFFKSRKEKGDILYAYTCCYPEEHKYLNRFIDMPQMFSRLLMVACFSREICGFLHWGGTFWDNDLYGVHAPARFKGDGFLLYPDPQNNTVGHSNRGIQTILGIQDWELLNMLAKKNKTLALALSRQIAEGFLDYTNDAKQIELVNDKVLQTLAK